MRHILETVLLQLERLRRNYEVAFQIYDEVSFLDLLHTLRVWSELDGHIEEVAPNFSKATLFKTARPIRKVTKATRECEYVYAAFPGHVKTHANKGTAFYTPDKSSIKTPFVQGVRLMVKSTHTEIASFHFVGKRVDASTRRALELTAETSCNFTNWLGSEAVRLAHLDEQGVLEKVAISRKMIIKRVANTLNASHPSTNDQDELENRYDAPVKLLLEYGVGGLPLPYLICLKIAQDILSVSSKFFDRNESQM